MQRRLGAVELPHHGELELLGRNYHDGTEATFAETDGLPASGSGTVTFSSGSPSATLCSFSYPTDTSCTTSPTLDAGTYSGIEATFTDTDGFYSN